MSRELSKKAVDKIKKMEKIQRKYSDKTCKYFSELRPLLSNSGSLSEKDRKKVNRLIKKSRKSTDKEIKQLDAIEDYIKEAKK